MAFFGYKYYEIKKKEKDDLLKHQQLIKDIATNYNTYVKVSKDTDLYQLENSKYNKKGKISKGFILELDELDVDNFTAEIIEHREQISEQIKSVRLQRLDSQLNENQREFNMSCIGQEMICLCEGDDKTGRHLVFRTPYMQQCIIDKPDYEVSALQKIKITDANKASLRGKLII